MINKNAILRFDVIDRCLTDRCGYTITELVDACNQRYKETPGCETISVKNRQVINDMKTMASFFGVEIESVRDDKDHRVVRFSYKPGTRNMHGDRLLDEDYGELNQALMMLESFAGLPYVKKAAETIKKRIGSKEGRDVGVFAVDTNERLRNFEQLSEYFNFILRGKAMKVKYLAQYEYEREFLFQPYYLKQYNGRWFLFGWNYDFERKDGTKGVIQNLAIDRIVEKTWDRSRFSMENPPRKNDIDFSHYFDDIIGVTKYANVQPERILIKVNDKNDWFRLVTKPIHLSQQEDEDTRTITIEVRPNPELYAVLRQYEHIEVVSPESVRVEFLRRLSSIQEQYK